MKIYLTRHGQTQWNLKGRIQGSLDSDLTDKGTEDTLKLSKKLESINFDIAYTSIQNRAIETAKIILNNKVDIVKLYELNEIGVGNWEGMTYDDIISNYPEQFDKYKKSPHLYVPDNGGETYQVFENRVRKFVEILRDNSKDKKNILIVTHGLTYLMLLNIFEGKELQNLSKRTIPLGTSLSIIEYKNDIFNILVEGDSSHL